MARLPEAPAQPSVAILLSVFNGERFLRALLASLLAQTHRAWQLYWHDDGSADHSEALLRAFTAERAARHCGGWRVIADLEPAVLYRQHGGNMVGAPSHWLRRARGALVRGPLPFMSVLRQHVAALAAQPELLSPEAAHALSVIAAALAAPPWRRVEALSLPGLFRQTSLETARFRLWFLLG
ncbi:MAG: glycosyltransferase [Rhodospirillales bacterium]|nr:glycosyltransferase [Rhodospirillales bacterium]